MIEQLFKSKTDMILDELKKIKKDLDATKDKRPAHSYAKACRRYNTFLIHINDIPELDEEKRVALKSFIEQRKEEIPQEYIKEEEEKYQKRIELREKLGKMTNKEKRLEEPEFYRTVFPKTKLQMILSAISELELESKSVNEDNFMIKSSMSTSDIVLSLEYLSENLNAIPDLTRTQVEKLSVRINDSISRIRDWREEDSYEEKKDRFEKKSKWKKMIEWIRKNNKDKSIQPEKLINKYRQDGKDERV